MFLAFLIHFQQTNVFFICGNFSVKTDSSASKSAIVIKFLCANLALRTSPAKVLNSGVGIYLP